MATDEERKLIRRYDKGLEVFRAKAKETGEPVSCFEGWSDQRKVSYVRERNIELPEGTEASGLQPLEDQQPVVVPDSVLCDVTDDSTASENYKFSVGHYLSWHYAESDLRLEFGSSRKRSFVTRPFGTFVWYFRDQEYVVGLITDGQTGYVYGCITRVYREGVLERENVLLFKTESSAMDYIKGQGIHRLNFTGSYQQGLKVYKVNLCASILRKVIKEVACFRPKVDKVEPSPTHFETLILYAVEAPRIKGVFRITSKSLMTEDLNNKGLVVIKIPESEEPFVLNYRQLSSCALEFLHTKIFKHVTGTTPRNLYQVLSSVPLLRRKMAYATQFFMPNAPREDKPNGPDKGGHQLTRDEELELLNKKGTTYSEALHGGQMAYRCEEWIMNLWEDDDTEKGDVWFSDGSDLNSIIEHAQANVEAMALTKINSLSQVMYGANNWWGRCNQKLAANAILAMSQAICEVRTSIKRIPQFQHVAKQSGLPVREGSNARNKLTVQHVAKQSDLPVPEAEGSHAGNKLTMQELRICPVAMEFQGPVKMSIQFYDNMKVATKKSFNAILLKMLTGNENGAITGSSDVMKKLVHPGWGMMPSHRRSMEELIGTYKGGNGEARHGDGSADRRMDPKQAGLETMELRQKINLLHKVLRKRENDDMTLEELKRWMYGLHSTKEGVLKGAHEILLEKERVQKNGLLLHVSMVGPNGILVPSH